MQNNLLAAAVLCLLVGVGCTSSGARHALPQNLQAPNATPKLLAVYMPWFGDRSHIEIGYSSNDPGVMRKQIQQARHMGISAFVVDWYGESRPYSDHNFGLLQESADENNFQVALLYNEAEDDDGQTTDEAMAAMDKAYTAYIGPQAAHRNAYLTYDGHPMIFIFPKHGKVDWNRIAEHCSAWESTPFFFYKDDPPQQYAADFAGMYAWVQPGHQGWTPDGSNWGEQYLQNFYKNMINNHPDKIAIGGAWPGFNDSAAKWGLNRHMAARCGKTFDDTLRMPVRYYDSARPLPFLLIETWNDYEEGTAIERLSFTQCKDSGATGAAN